jgi:hypothetical protein
MDGFLDLSVANRGDDTISVLLHKGDGTYKSQSVYNAGSRPRYLTSDDVNTVTCFVNRKNARLSLTTRRK